MNNLLAAQTGRPLLVYESTQSGQVAYIEAARTALVKKDYNPLRAIIREAPETAKSGPSP
jgi:cell filamentation protein